MKCPYCGFENESGASYCGNCGKKLPEEGTIEKYSTSSQEESLLQLAEAFTGVRSAAKEIVEHSDQTIDGVCRSSIEWIKTKDPDLFKEKVLSVENKPMLEDLSDIEKELQALDYEERIAVLVHIVGRKNFEDTASMAGTDPDTIKGLLQSAYLKNYPEGKKEVKVKEETPVQVTETKTIPAKKHKSVPAKKKASSNKNGLKIKIGLAVGIALVLGIFFGVKSYASERYTTGIADLDSKNYTEAAEALKTAKKFGHGGDTVLKLGDAYVGCDDYKSASAEYKEYYTANTDDAEVKTKLANAYDALADESIKAEDNDTAKEYLQNEYDLTHDELTSIRIQAIENNGTYTSASDGAIYNVYGNPIKVYAHNSSSAQLYQVDVDYDSDGKVSTMSEYVKEGARVTTLKNFTFGSGSEVHYINWFPMNNSPASYESTYYVYDDNGYIKSIQDSTPDGMISEKDTNTYDDSGNIEKCIRIFDDGTPTITETYHYNGNLMDSMTSEQEGGTFIYRYTYDKNEILQEITIELDGSTVGELKYTYDEQNRVTDVYETHSVRTFDDTDPFIEDRHIQITYSATGKKMTLNISAGQNSSIASGYYIQGCGWLVLYNTYVNGN